jgi:hypothetical protein
LADRVQIEIDVNAGSSVGNINKVNNALDKLDDGVGKAGSSGGKFGGVFDKLGGTIAGFGGPVGIAAAGLATLGAGLIAAGKAAAEEQVGIERLNKTLQNSIPGWDGNTKAVEKYIAKQEKLAFADDQLRDSLNQLVAQTGNLAEAQDLQALAMDLSRAKGMDLMTATKLVGKVDMENIGILQRYGIAVDKNATKEEALAAIRKQTAGQAKAYANTTAGALERIQNTFGNMVEDIGGKVLELVAGPLQSIAEFLQSDDFAGVAEFVGDAMGVVFESMGKALETVGTAIGVFKNIWEKDWGGIRTIVETVWNVISTIYTSLQKGLEQIGQIFGGVLEFLGLKEKDAAAESANFAAAYDKLMGNTADTASAAAGKIGTDLPAGFKAAADGSITELARIPAAASRAYEDTEAALSHFQDAHFEVKATPSAVIQPFSEDELDRHVRQINAMLEAGMSPTQIQMAVSSQVHFTQIAIPPEERASVEARIEELAQGGVGAQQSKIIIERELQIKANVAQVEVDSANMLRQVKEAIERGGLTDSPIRVFEERPIEVECATELSVNWSMAADSNEKLKAKVLASVDAGGVGQAVSEGIALGMSKTYATPLQAVGGMITQIVFAANAALESHSPSQVFYRIGEGITAGLGNGITATGESAKGPLASIISAMQSAAQTGLASSVFSPFGAAANAGIAAGIGGGTGAGMAAAGAGAALGGGAVGAASSMAQGVKNAVAGILTSAAFFSVGSAIPAGVANGIAAGASRAIGAASAMARNALKAAKDALGIASPSKEFHIMGEEMQEGTIEGQLEKAPKLYATTAAIVTMAAKYATTAAEVTFPKAGAQAMADWEEGARKRLKGLPEDDFREYTQAMGGALYEGVVIGAEKGWAGGAKGRSLEQILKDGACGAAHKAAQHVDECGEVIGTGLTDGTARGVTKGSGKIYDAYDAMATRLIEEQKAHNEHLKAGWDTYAERAIGTHHKIARNVLSDLEAMANATTDYLARMESGIVAVGNAVSGVNAYTYGAGNGAESPGSSGSGRTVVPMANGGSGWVNKPTLFLAGEAGREFVSFTPQSTPVLAGGGGGPVVHVYIDGVPVTPRQVRALAEAVGTQHRGGTR